MASNFLLDALASQDLERLRPRLTPVTFSVGDVVYEPEDGVTHVWFPLSGLCSIVSMLLNGAHIESSAVGRESGVGFIEACGGGLSHSLYIVQMAGKALRAPAEAYRTAFDASKALRKTVGQHIELLLTEARQEIACHAAHHAEARLARWLLVCRDKSGLDDLQMTQAFLATMIAPQRTTVSAIASQMKEAGLIRYSRGKVKICDAEGLERQACECYATMKHFREVMGQPAGGAQVALEVWPPS